MPQDSPNFAGAVDLAQLGGGLEVALPDAEPMPEQFQISLVGDDNGEPRVQMAFGHLRWLFDPELASELGVVLLDAALQARAMPPGPVEDR
jgi:hypothetical protein